MGDRTSVEITIGGDLPSSLLDELVSNIWCEGLTFEWGMGPEPTAASVRKAIAPDEIRPQGYALTLSANDVNYGSVDAVQAFCEDNGLSYRLEWDAGGEYGPGAFLYLGNERYEYATQGIGTDLVLSATEIMALGSYEAVLARIEARRVSIPPLRLTDETSA